MDANEKRKVIQGLMEVNERVDYFFQQALENMGDLKCHYWDYMTTAPVNCDEELKRVADADYELCTALLTMLLREDHFINGSFERRMRAGDVKPVLERMLEVLE